MRTDRILGAAVVVAGVVAYFLFDSFAFVRALGVATFVSGLLAVWAGELPVGIEGRPPSFYLRGVAAVIGGIAIAALGCILVWFAPEVERGFYFRRLFQ